MALVDVIKYEGDNSVLVWKHPVEDFNTKSQLIVHESQDAVFYNGGQRQHLFGAGTYTLTTKNYPFIGSLLKMLTGGVSAFHCEVYFVNKAEAMSLKWGTRDRVTIMEQGVPLKLGAGGDLSLTVSDTNRLLGRIVGTEAALGKEKLISYFQDMINSYIGDFLANTVAELGLSFFELDRHKREFSNKIKELLQPEFEDYGVSIQQFNLSRFLLPEDDPNYQRMVKLYGERRNDYFAKDTEIGLKLKDTDAENEIQMRNISAEKDRNVIENDIKRQNASGDADAMETLKLREAEVEAKAEILKAQAMKAKRELEGYSYQEEQSFNIAKEFAKNQSDNEMTSLGIGLGTIGGVGNVVGDYLNTTVNTALAAAVAAPQIGALMRPQSAAGSEPAKTVTCAKCGAELPENAKFCLGCGEKVVIVQEGEVICPSCGKPTPKGKFCMECGTPLVNKCPNCGQEVPQGGKFCLECGTKL